METIQEFDRRIAALHGLDRPTVDRAVEGTSMDIRHAEFSAMADVFLGPEYDSAKRRRVADLQAALHQKQAELSRRHEQGNMSDDEFADAANDAINDTFKQCETILGAADFARLFGSSPDEIRDLIDREAFLKPSVSSGTSDATTDGKNSPQRADKSNANTATVEGISTDTGAAAQLPPSSHLPKRKIAILGGGVGAMTTAFALTSQPGWQDNYEVTIYQLGWRLGGKGASGRNADYGQRIEEHGLHIWFGFYENAFRMMRAAYQECNDRNLYPTTPFKSWDDAYKPQNLLTCMEDINGTWKRWDFDYPTNDRLPGDGDDSLLLRPWDYVVELLRWLTTWHDESLNMAVKSIPSFLVSSVEQLIVGIKNVAVGIFGEAWSVTGTAIHHAFFLSKSLPEDPANHTSAQHHTLLALVDQYRESFRAATGNFLDRDDDLRRHWILVDLVVSMIRGIIADGIIYRGFDIIDIYDSRAWLERHGCTSADSSPVRGMYDLVFAYVKGNTQKPNFAAGTALRATLRILFCYKGSILWKMQAGMGDTVFSPIYLALKNRGVKFRFFHRVRNLGLSADKTVVEQIAVDVQATVKGGGEYQPLVNVKGLPCWPSTPLYDQLVEGEELKKSGANLESAWCPPPSKPLTLQRGVDFDDIVMGISLGGLPYVATELIAANPAWAKMVTNLATVQTQAVQLWMNRDADGLGWVASERAVLGAYVEPLDTWADMTQVLDKEDQPAALNVRNIAYFCGVIQEDPPAPFTDCSFPAKQEARVKAQALEFLNNDAGPLWPRAIAAGTQHLDWNVIADPAGQQGPARLDEQFFRVNIDPTERYALSLAGSTTYRLRADQAGFSNVFLAGDWTYNGINLGCVEAGAISGMQASRALCGFPKVIPGESDVLS